MPAKTLLVTRPNHDLITNYLFFWAGLVVKLAKNKGFKILDLPGIKANYRVFVSYVKKHHPKLVFLNGHGSADTITGKDEVATLFLEPSNLIPMSLIKGNIVENAYQKSQNAMRRNFWFMLSTKAAQNQKDAAPYLWANRKNQVLLGNPDAKL